MAGSAAAVVGAAATPCRPPQPRQGSHARCRRHCRLPPVRAGLLDLLRGSGTSDTSLPQDSHGEELRAWMQARGMPPQQVRTWGPRPLLLARCLCCCPAPGCLAQALMRSPTPCAQLAAVAVPGAGRGLAAAQAISAGEPLLRLPPDLILTPDAAQRASVLRPLLEASPLPAWSVLALWLAEARAAGEGSEWWPYVRLLPDRTGCVLEWSEEEVGWLRGSQLHASALEIRRAADASWQEMQPLLADGEAQGLAPRGAFNREALQWAFAMLLSRLVRLPSLGGGGGGGEPSGTETLLPWADLLNHSPDCTAFLDWSPADGAVVLRADRRCRAGEQVHVSYGQKTGGELLLRCAHAVGQAGQGAGAGRGPAAAAHACTLPLTLRPRMHMQLWVQPRPLRQPARRLQPSDGAAGGRPSCGVEGVGGGAPRLCGLAALPATNGRRTLGAHAFRRAGRGGREQPGRG